MLKIFEILIIIFTCSVFIAEGSPAENINGVKYSMVQLLDTVGKNFLFRSVKPVSNHAFLYDELVE
jgi:hypothetical protein